MSRLFKILAAFLFVLSSLSFMGDKDRLLAEALAVFNDEARLSEIIPIVKRTPPFDTEIPVGCPLDEQYRVSSTFGYRNHPIDKTKEFHSGIDLSALYASKILATADGKVIFAGKKRGYGKTVVIEHKYGFKSVYAHMTLFYTKKNNPVKKGDVIGFLGSTGKSTGDHLHYEIKKNDKPINPQIFFQ